jgi:hypothetical protein
MHSVRRLRCLKSIESLRSRHRSRRLPMRPPPMAKTSTRLASQRLGGRSQGPRLFQIPGSFEDSSRGNAGITPVLLVSSYRAVASIDLTRPIYPFRAQDANRGSDAKKPHSAEVHVDFVTDSLMLGHALWPKSPTTFAPEFLDSTHVACGVLGLLGWSGVVTVRGTRAALREFERRTLRTRQSSTARW